MITSRHVIVVVSLLLAVPSAGCSSSPPSANVDPAYPDVILQGSTTDAALAAFLTATAVTDPSLAAAFDNPKDLATLPGAPILTFTWHDAQTTAMRLVPAPARFTFEGVLADLLGERTAYAGTTMSGPGYVLAFRALDTDEALFRVFTSSTSYTPDATAWAKIATGLWTTLQITSATFAGDKLAAGSSPVTGQSIKFCIGAWQ